jgi:hypothetical protein
MCDTTRQHSHFVLIIIYLTVFPPFLVYYFFELIVNSLLWRELTGLIIRISFIDYARVGHSGIIRNGRLPTDLRSRHTVVGIATDYGVDSRGSISGREKIF